MQAMIRATSEEDGLLRKKFVRYHEKGLLTDPEEAGRKLLRSLDDERIENGTNVDVRELYR